MTRPTMSALPLEGEGKIFGWYDAKGDLFACPPVGKHNAQSFNSPYRFCRNVYSIEGEGKRERSEKNTPSFNSTLGNFLSKIATLQEI